MECLREESAYLSQAKDFAGPLSVITSLSDAADALDLAEASIAAERRRVEELEAALAIARPYLDRAVDAAYDVGDEVPVAADLATIDSTLSVKQEG